MSYLHDLFNVTNDFELNKILESLDLSYNDMINIDSISRHKSPIQFRQNELLEYLAGTTDGNYEKAKSQLSKVYKPRTLKEASGLNLNQVMELNQLVQLVAQKLDIEQCMTGVYNIIKTKANENIAKAFIGMVQQSSVNQSSLKFNTDLNIGGQNLAQVIYQLKNDIEMFVNSVERPKEEKKEVKENVQHFTSEDIHQQVIKESFSKYQEIITQLNKAVDDMADINLLQSVSDKVNELMSRVKNMNEANDLATLKSTIETKINNLMGSKARIEECCLATQIAANACEEDTFNSLLDGVKPTVINITVNKEDNGILPCVDDCCAEPCCVEPCCVDDCCCEPHCDCGDDCVAPIVQPMNFEPTAIDAPILRKPNSAEVTSAITALSSHSNDIKSDSRENNLENLQTINTLLSQISNYFNQLLGESVEYKRINEGILGLPIKEMSNFEDFNSLIVENYRQYAGILDLNDNTLFYLPQGAIHHNYIKESDVFNGKVRFGVAEYRGKVVGYISSDSREHVMKALKILKRELSSAPISYWMVEYFEDGQRVRMNIDDNGRTVYENKNDWFPAWGNAEKILETCSAGACCAASVATVPSKSRKNKPRKAKSIDVELFKESIQDDLPSTLTINGKKVAYKIVEGKGYLYIDNGIVKTLDKNVMLETVDDVYNNCLDIEVLEGFNAYDLQIIMEDYITPEDDSQQSTIITPAEKQKQQEKLDNQINNTPDMKVGVVNADNPNEIKQNQQIVGVDDSNINDKKYIVKDPMTGDVKIANFDQIKVLEKK